MKIKTNKFPFRYGTLTQGDKLLEAIRICDIVYRDKLREMRELARHTSSKNLEKEIENYEQKNRKRGFLKKFFNYIFPLETEEDKYRINKLILRERKRNY